MSLCSDLEIDCQTVTLRFGAKIRPSIALRLVQGRNATKALTCVGVGKARINSIVVAVLSSVHVAGGGQAKEYRERGEERNSAACSTFRPLRALGLSLAQRTLSCRVYSK